MTIESLFLNIPASFVSTVVLVSSVMFLLSVFPTMANIEGGRKIQKFAVSFGLSVMGVCASTALLAGMLFWTGVLPGSQADAIEADFMQKVEEAGFERVELVQPLDAGDSSSLKVLVGTLDGEYVRCVLIDESNTEVRLDCG